MGVVRDVGDRYEFRVEFRNKTGAVSDPATVTLRLEKPDGTFVGPWTWAAAEITREALGIFFREHTLDQRGTWTAEWVTTGIPELTEFEQVEVREAKIPGAPGNAQLIDLPYAKRHIRNVKEGDEDLIVDYIDGYSAAVAKYTNREFIPKVPASDADPVVARTFKYDGSGFMSFERQEAREITAVRVDALGGVGYEDVDVLIWEAGPVEKTDEGTYFWLTFTNRWRRQRAGFKLEVTGRWGIGFVPGDVKLATVIAVAHLYRNPENLATRNVGEWDIAEETGDTDPYAGSLPRASRNLLLPYMRRRASITV